MWKIDATAAMSFCVIWSHIHQPRFMLTPPFCCVCFFTRSGWMRSRCATREFGRVLDLTPFLRVVSERRLTLPAHPRVSLIRSFIHSRAALYGGHDS